MTLLEYITFDDVVIVPSKATVEPKDVSLKTSLTRNVRLYIPLVSSPMDTVTEWRLATLLARLGGIGVIHRNMSVEEQAEHVRRVKAQEPSVWAEIPRVSVKENLEKAFRRLEEAGSGACIVVGDDQSKACGILLAQTPIGLQDYWFSKAKALSMLLEELEISPCVDDSGRLRVGAAVGPYDVNRVRALEREGVDVIVVDVAHFHNTNVISAVSQLSKETSADLVVGNLATKEGILDTLAMVDRVDGIRVGISSGSICKTGVVAGTGVPTLTATLNARDALEELGLFGKIPIIADGGFRGSGDVVKALVAGASAVMTGRLFASSEEAASPKVRIGSRVFKVYRGMGSLGALQRRHAIDRYSRPSKLVEEGIEGLVEYRGSAIEVVAELVSGIKAGLGYAGCASIRDAWKGRLAKVTASGRSELGPHDVVI